MVYCTICDEYIGLLTFQRFCNECSDIRRLIKLEGNSKRFLERIKKLFLVQKEDIEQNKIIEQKKEIEQTNKNKQLMKLN